MFRLVVDTNVLVSSLIGRGAPRQLILRVDGRNVRLISSRMLFDELVSVLAEDRIARYVDRRDVEGFLRYIGKRTVLVKSRSGFKVVREDPKDDVVLNTAYSGKVDFIVSGDRHLVHLREFKGIRIVTVGEMLGMLTKRNRIVKAG